jgi:anaerobic magnesium-protoporphyrin IX monomethyl ester cyclase
MSAPAVLLINPRMCSPRSTRLPLSLLHLAAALDADRPWRILDGNVEPELASVVLAALSATPHALVGITVMPGPQVAPAIAISSAIRDAYPSLPIVWGGYFPTLYPDAALHAPYVDYVVRGQGEQTLLELLARVGDAGPPSALDSARDTSAIAGIAGLSWKSAGAPVHNADRPVIPPAAFPALPYHRLDDVVTYLRPSFLGERTAAHQVALGCRYRCEFCGVVSMWNGKTLLDAPERLEHALTLLRDRWGADSVQFFDHNFFDGEESSVPILDVLGTLRLPWWCYARADTLAGFSAAIWQKIRRSNLRMAYIGAEAASDEALKRMHKGSRVDQTLEVAVRCREYGVIPEFSFVLGGPQDPEGEIEKTFAFIRRLKELNPQCEIILYFYTPTPQRAPARSVKPGPGPRLPMLESSGPSGTPTPTTPEEWAEPLWVSWACHQEAPWLTPRLRERVKDFGRVLECRFPTVQDYRTPAWGKAILRGLAGWRYARQRYDRPWELALASRLIPLHQPKSESL